MFVATSTASAEQTIFYNQRYEFEFSRQELQRRFVQLDLRSFSVEHLPVSGHDIPDIYQGKLDKDICASAVGRAKIEAYSIAEDRSSLALAGYGPRNENFVLVTTIQTVAAVYDRRRFVSRDISAVIDRRYSMPGYQGRQPLASKHQLQLYRAILQEQILLEEFERRVIDRLRIGKNRTRVSCANRAR